MIFNAGVAARADTPVRGAQIAAQSWTRRRRREEEGAAGESPLNASPAPPFKFTVCNCELVCT